ncbi:hypothetical protein Trydic_g10877 [Trypoxylus dichotomus]
MQLYYPILSFELDVIFITKALERKDKRNAGALDNEPTTREDQLFENTTKKKKEPNGELLASVRVSRLRTPAKTKATRSVLVVEKRDTMLIKRRTLAVSAWIDRIVIVLFSLRRSHGYQRFGKSHIKSWKYRVSLYINELNRFKV